jgi:predicted nucleotidyltransferase
MTLVTSDSGKNPSESSVDILEAEVNATWKNLRAGKDRACKKRQEITDHLLMNGVTSDAYSVVVNGSLARDEFTEGSDIDWTLLVDGPVDPTHAQIAKKIRNIISKLSNKKTGREGVFGRLTFSHELVHQIGGEDDRNSNTTRRILLLLESCALGRSEAHFQVVRGVLKRYLEPEFEGRRESISHVPRFLLNDVTRYWRTMTVDFAYKMWDRQNEGRELRNIKLRISRKLIFVSGLLSCFGCDLGLVESRDQCAKFTPGACVECLQKLLRNTPLEILAKTVLLLVTTKEANPKLREQAKLTLTAYDQFLGLLADQGKRGLLEEFMPDDQNCVSVKEEAKSIAKSFSDGIEFIFFEGHPNLAKLIRHYGVF